MRDLPRARAVAACAWYARCGQVKMLCAQRQPGLSCQGNESALRQPQSQAGRRMVIGLGRILAPPPERGLSSPQQPSGFPRFQ